MDDGKNLPALNNVADNVHDMLSLCIQFQPEEAHDSCNCRDAAWIESEILTLQGLRQSLEGCHVPFKVVEAQQASHTGFRDRETEKLAHGECVQHCRLRDLVIDQKPGNVSAP